MERQAELARQVQEALARGDLAEATSLHAALEKLGEEHHSLNAWYFGATTADAMEIDAKNHARRYGEKLDREIERDVKRHFPDEPTIPARRKPIPEGVRHEVWRRDRGECVVCHSRDRLEFDHIIPVSKGGSNTARNIELRCEAHNRQKGARI